MGDGESDEPESLGALSLAARSAWTISFSSSIAICNASTAPFAAMARSFRNSRGSSERPDWNVIKVVWCGGQDDLLSADKTGLLLKRMEEAVDGEYQKYTVERGSYIRRHFFGKYPELLRLVDHLTDDQLTKLLRGGHDQKKVYTAYKAAMEFKGGPTVILAKTVKGYGLGEAAEGRNISHQQKKLNEKELRKFRARFDIPIKDEEIADTPFYRPPPKTREIACM